jgi:hypothetical protein
MLQRVVRTLGEQLSMVRAHELQPTFYLTVAGIGLAEAFSAGTGARNARLQSLPGFLARACGNLCRVPRLFRDLGIDMLGKQRSWLDSLTLPSSLRSPLNAALKRFGEHLEQVATTETILPPVSLYERIACHHMGCMLAPDEIAGELDREIDETRAFLNRSAASMAPGKRWQQVVDGMPRPPIPAGGMAELYQDAIAALARHCTAMEVSHPALTQDCPVAVAPIPAYMRPVRSNAAYSMPPGCPPLGGTFFIEETDGQAVIPADYRLLTAHETYPGHHLLDTLRWLHERPIRRHIEFPVFYEGWASFAEELMFDTGFFSSTADGMLMAKRRFWRAMRGRVDFDIHMRRRSLTEAQHDLVAAGMAPRRARAMIRRYCLKPGYQLAYTIGRRRFRELYDTFIGQGGDAAGFARRVLAQGEIGFHHLAQVLRQGGGV